MPITEPFSAAKKRTYVPFKLDELTVYPDLNRVEGPLAGCRLEPKVMALLLHLVMRPEQVVSRQELLELIWSDVVVCDQALTRCLSQLRKKLAQCASRTHYIKTMSKKGYCLMVSPAPLARTDTHISPTDVDGLREGSALVDRLLAGAADTIAIMPLQRLSHEEVGSFLGVGFARDLTQLLSLIPGLGVVASSSIEHHYKEMQNPVKLANLLAARYVVSGAIEYRDKSFRLRVELFDTATGKQLWANRYDDRIDNFFTVQDDLVEQVGRSLSAALAEGKAEEIRSRGAFDLSVYERIQLAEDARRNYSREAANFIVENLNAVLLMQPTNGVAHALLAMQLSQNLVSGWCEDASTTRELAAVHLQEALRHAPNDSRVLMASGISALMQGRHKDAMFTLQRSLEKNPNEAHTLAEYGTTRFYVTRELVPSIALIEQAELAAPQHPRFSIWAYRRGICYYESGLYTAAIQAMDEGILRTPNYHHIYLTKALVLIAMDARFEARAVIAKGKQHAPGMAPLDFLNGVQLFGLTVSDDQIETFQALWEAA